MNGKTKLAIQLFADVCKGERYIHKKNVELLKAVVEIPQEDIGEYARITQEIATMSDEKIAAVEAVRHRRSR